MLKCENYNHFQKSNRSNLVKQLAKKSKLTKCIVFFLRCLYHLHNKNQKDALFTFNLFQ